MADKRDLDGELAGEMVSEGGTSLVIPDSVLPSRLYILPAPKRPFFPAQVQPIMLDMALWQETLQKGGDKPNHIMGLLYCGESLPGALNTDELPAIGCAVPGNNW